MSVSLIDQSTQNCHFSFQLFISNACILEGVLNTGSDVSICCVSLPRASFSRKMLLQLIFSSCASRLDDKDTASEGSRKRDKRPEMYGTNFIACVYVAGGFFVWFSVLVRPRARANEETMEEGARGREKDRYTRLACVAGAKRGGRKREGWEKGRIPYPLSPIPLPFSIFSRYPQPLSAPAYIEPLETFETLAFFLTGDLSYDDGNGSENFTQKWDSCCSKFHRSYSDSSSVRFCT